MACQSYDKFDESSSNTHEYEEDVIVDSQWPKLVCTKPQEGCQHGMNKSNLKDDHFALNFRAIDFLFEVESKEKEIFLESKNKREFATRGIYGIFW